MFDWFFLGLVTAVSYSLMTVISRYVLKNKDIHAVAYAPIQLCFSAAFIFLLALLLNELSVPANYWFFGLLIAPFIYLAGLLWSLAAHSKEASFISPLLQTNTLFLLLIGVLFLSEKLSSLNVFGIVFIFFGGYLVVSNGFRVPNLSEGFYLVVLSAFIDAIGKTIMSVTVGKGAISLSLVIFFYMMLMSWFVSFSFDRKDLKKALRIIGSQKKYFYSTVLRGFLSFVATTSFILALQSGLLSKVGAVSNTVPLFTVAFGALLLKESKIRVKLFASLLVVIGLLLL